MSTQSDKPNDVPAPTAPHDLHDDHSGVYGWFRRNQKRLLYTVGLFVLITFSVSGPMIAMFGELTRKVQPMPHMTIGGQRVEMTELDFQIGQKVANHQGGLASVLPRIDVGEGGQTQLGDAYGYLRCAARYEGIEVSMAEVDRAIETMLASSSGIKSATQLAGQKGFASLADFRATCAEAMRIGTLIRLQTLALDDSDASVLRDVMVDREKITFLAAVFDEKARDEELKKAGGLTDDDLHKWLDGKTEAEKQRLQVYDSNRVALKIGGFLLAEFDRTEWLDGALKDFTIGDEQRQKLYNMERERFKDEKGDYKPVTDEAVKAELDKLLETEKVLNTLKLTLTEKANTAEKAANEEITASGTALKTKQDQIVALKKQLEEKPDDAQAKEDLRLAEEALPALENAKKAAQDAANELHVAFDFPAEFAALVAGKKGVVQRAFTELRNEEELKDLEANGLGLGQWSMARNATYHQRKGDLCFGPNRSDKAAFLYQVADLQVRPLKVWDKLKPLLESAYCTEKAKQEAEEKKTKLEEALLRLAKAKMPEKVQEIEGKRQSRIDEALAAWEKKTQDKIAEAKDEVQHTRAGTEARAAWERSLATQEALLAKKDARKDEIAKEIDKAIADEIGVEAKKFHGEVLREAAAEAGFTVTELPARPRDIANEPRFDKRFDPTVVYLFKSHKDMKEGESTGVVQDTTERRWICAVCTKVAPLEASDVTRREFELHRKGYGYGSFALTQAASAYQQAFTIEALEKRYKIEKATGEQEKK